MVEIAERFKSVHNPDIVYEMPLQLVLNRPLDDIDLFIGYLNDYYPELTDSFFNRLCSKLQKIDKDTEVETDIFEFEPDNLKDYPELEEEYKRVVLKLLGYEKYESAVSDGKGKFVFKDVLHSYLIPAACLAETIVELLPREDGLEFYRNYVDYRTDYEKGIQPKESLEAFFNFVKSSYTENPQEQSFFLGKDGALYAKITSCLWSKILKEFDPEIAYSVACHFDFNAAKHYNENFVLTRTKTIMQGDRYCDFCWRDTRLGSRDHPDDSFWEKLE
ncbi:MAG: L-2-amino-thiazoline-4-carboxylic acid hydrolase [Candidatus Thorarchaeota archaeon]